jgi:hypothetical protein
MNYKHLYQQFLSTRPIRVKPSRLDGSLCVHHILPRSIGGTDSKDNLIVLTPKEHYFAHKLLYKFNTGLAKSKMAGALVSMLPNYRRFISSKRYVIEYEKYREWNREQAKAHWQRPEYRAKFITPGSKGSRYNANGTRRIPIDHICIYTKNRSKEDRCSMLLAKWKRRGVKPNYGYLDKITSA